MLPHGECWDTPPKLLHLASHTTQVEAQCLVGLCGFYKQCIPHLGVLLQPIYQWPEKLLVLSEAQKRRRLCNRSELLCKVLCYWVIWSADPRVLEVSAADGDVVWSFGQALISKLQNRPLGFWRKALESSVGNCSPFEKQFLAWAFSETEYLPWVTKSPCDLYCLSWTGHFLTYQTIKIGMHSKTPSSNVSGLA